MINVQVRHRNEATSLPIGQVPADKLDWFLEQMSQWGLYVDGEVVHDFTGQFVVDTGGAYFEIIAGADD